MNRVNTHAPEVIDKGRLSDQSLARHAAMLARQEAHFVKGPIPLPWIESAASIGGKSVNVALALWFKHGIVKGDSFTVSRKLLDRFCVGRHASGKILKKMSERGLIELTEADGKAPRAKVITVGGGTDRKAKQ